MVQNYRYLFELCDIHNSISDILKNGEKKNCCSMRHMLKNKYKCINCKALDSFHMHNFCYNCLSETKQLQIDSFDDDVCLNIL